MNAYELQQARSAELLRQAEHERLAREAVRTGRAARRDAAERATAERSDGDAENEPHTPRLRRLRFARPS
ncbi:hypothetical protein SAMN04487983_105123 [Streptomyces sp. yr375]|uniref:hypothetical protein n=1 Tax=Streptomyces sp. yr375 TaxID=1761906 RepID=UPI0008D6A003|nr:hypothetical protein [Streptomyces sp. yr375]SES41573.1 hypothetical protein SAMN04487983_105123 [Streptomyces sp. yr375]